MRWLRVVADDLTGACDVAAALLPMPNGVVVENPSRWTKPRRDDDPGYLIVRNTQSRTLAPAAAAARVREALADIPADWSGVVLKKIDTGLRGPLGAEIDAAMDAAGADLALVLPAIPEAGRTTVRGRQLADGVPVHETSFARDPRNPVTDAHVGTVIEATSRRRTASASVEDMERGGVESALARWRAEGATVIVGDARTDADLERWLLGLDVETTALPRYFGRRTVVLVGSTGIARALRRGHGGGLERGLPSPVKPLATRTEGVLVVAGSLHPTTHAQLAHAERAGSLQVLRVDLDAPAAAGAAAARELRAGRHVALAVPEARNESASTGAPIAMAEATRVALGPMPPRALLLIGGETAFEVLTALGDPRLWIDRNPAPLAVCSIILDGELAGLSLVTKGGSSGPPERLAGLIAEVAA